MDATSDRDFLLEFTQSLATLGVTSRGSRRSSRCIQRRSLDSSICRRLSHRIERDAAEEEPRFTELVRGKSARLAGAATTLAVLLKGLPLAYNKDLQEGQEPVFDAADTVRGILGILPAFTRS